MSVDKVKFELPTTKSKIDKKWENQKFVMLGPGGIGKSHFWSMGEKTLFLQFEAGLGFLEVMKVPITTWGDFQQAGAALLEMQQKGEFAYDTIVIDTLDRFVALASAYVIAKARQKYKDGDKIETIADIPNGAGWYQATNLVFLYLAKLESFPCATVLIGHHNLKKIKEGGREYDKSTISIGGQTGCQLLHWPDHLLYLEGKMMGDNLVRKVHTLPSQIREGKSRGGIVPDGWAWVDDMSVNYKKLRGLFD